MIRWFIPVSCYPMSSISNNLSGRFSISPSSMRFITLHPNRFIIC